MRSTRRGKGTSEVEVTNVSAHGFWVLVRESEKLVSFKEFPWFRDATIAQLTRVELAGVDHLYWPDLDVDLALESLDHPERYPLVSKGTGSKNAKPRPQARERWARYKSARKRRRAN